MCGIAGKVMCSSDGPNERDVVRAMGAQLIHRGPDEEGVYVDRQAAMVMRRLAIQDLTSGRLPITNEGGDVTVVFNGEIYNFKDLRRTLEARGHLFRTRTDTEVLVHLYEDHGSEFIDHLRGMFAIGLWDARDRTLWLARDRLGKKPLYYFVDEQGLRFGSEIKAILADPSVPRQIDVEALAGILTLGYPPQPHTFFRGVKELPPGLFC